MPLETHSIHLPTLRLKTDPDEALFLDASNRWHACIEGMRDLLAGASEINNPVHAVEDAWITYWDARAPGTPVSRRERASQLYRDHLEAATHLAFAQRTLSAEQIKPMLAILDASSAGQRPEAWPAQVEQIALLLSNTWKVKLPGAMVIGLGAGRLLYLPGHSNALTSFSSRSDMEDWLARQSLIPQGLPTDNIRYEYSPCPQPLATGINDLLCAQCSSLCNDGTDKRRHQYRNNPVFAAPPELEQQTWQASDSDVEIVQPWFGSLAADIPWGLRQTALSLQRQALETLLTGDEAPDTQNQLDTSFQALEAAEQAANAAASALLYRKRTLDLATFNRQFTALHQALKDGLHAEAGIQRALNQLDADEHNMLETLLGTPTAHDQNIAVASLSLSLAEHHGSKTTVKTETLKGPFVVTRPAALLDLTFPCSVIIYWPGAGGGLQRFPNCQALARQLFNIQDHNPDLSLQLKRLRVDPLVYSLDQQITVFEEQAGELRQRYADSAQVEQRSDALEKLRQRTLAALQVPVNEARNLAFSHLKEQNRSALMTSHLPDWLVQLPADDRSELKSLIDAYIRAMHRSHEQLEIALIPRDDFTRQHLQARLREDFSIKGHFDVQLDLPDSVKLQKQLSDGSTPTTPHKLVALPSAKRSKMSLEELAQLNLDNTPSMQLEPLSLRLGFMRVEVTTADESERQTLTAGITLPYLRKVLPALDLPKAYEQLILDTFMGSLTEPVFTRDHRRECLIEPWRLMLKLQGECARLQKQISHDDLRILNIAIDASTPEAWHAEQKRILILPAHLSAGGKYTRNEGPVTLSGVTFIEEQISGATLLYLPESPDGQFLRRYNNLEAARKGLFNLCLHSKMVSYLADRALQGDVPAHENRINRAVLKHFDAMIGVGVRWPATTSLAAYMLNAHMGRLVEAHRGTSRSNDALFLERYALAGPRVFDYMKMAMGLVPFVGTAIAFYDAWNDANQAVAAFLRGDVGDGLTEVESVLLSLIDGAMDLFPGEVATSAMSKGARKLTRARQLRALSRNAAALQVRSLRQAQKVVARFAGYEYEKPISLLGLHPVPRGFYRNIYRHADGDFIIRQGRIFQVEPSKDSRNWRLSGTRQKTYKQPIALDEAGQWDTWFGVHGTTFEGGGLGGGNVVGHLADGLDPYWPEFIRARLPRFMADPDYRHTVLLQDTINDLSGQFNARKPQSLAAFDAYRNANKEDLPELRQAADSACIGDIELATRQFRALSDLRRLPGGDKPEVVALQSACAWVLADRVKLRVDYASNRSGAVIERADEPALHLDQFPQALTRQFLDLVEELRQVRMEFMRELDQIIDLMGQMNHWFELINRPKRKKKVPTEDDEHFAALAKGIQDLNERYSANKILPVKIGHLLEIVKRVGDPGDLPWVDLQRLARDLRAKVDRALFIHFSLAEVSVTPAQRNQILQSCLEIYTQFRRAMNVWTSSYPQYFHMDAVAPLLKGIELMAERARKGIGRRASATHATQTNKRVFTTEDNELLIGVEHWEPTTQKQQYVLTGEAGYREIWEQGNQGKFHLLNRPGQEAASVQTNLVALVADARRRLASQQIYRFKVQSYAEQDMLPVDLEHMMVSEADELIHRAERIERLDAQNTIIASLRAKAIELRTTGRAMRTRQSLTTRKPTDGMLEDLIGQNAVEIRKTVPIKNLGKHKDRRTDYMQEYEIWDLTVTPPKLLWYAHFHYTKAAAEFGKFEKAHLKLPEHRFLTHADDADLPYADIGKNSAALQHFERI